MISKVEQPMVRKHQEFREKGSGLQFEVLAVGIAAASNSLVVIYTGYSQLLVRTQKDFLQKFEQIS